MRSRSHLACRHRGEAKAPSLHQANQASPRDKPTQLRARDVRLAGLTPPTGLPLGQTLPVRHARFDCPTGRMPSTGSTRSDESLPPLLLPHSDRPDRAARLRRRACPIAPRAAVARRWTRVLLPRSRGRACHRSLRRSRGRNTHHVVRHCASRAADTMGSRRCRKPTCGGPRRRRRPGRRYRSTPEAVASGGYRCARF